MLDCLEKTKEILTRKALYNETETRNSHIKTSSRFLNIRNIRPRDEEMLWGAKDICLYYNKPGRILDHLATRCEKMLVM
ncbi:hypothetical protein CWI38_0126p0060 [Hamiltosporidium tvaerminnensis]|uniref:Uncharacterized protein n=1 Tax=Hamiltosporidium tvaerminnensis TaxID=1176355 RepID=A0A4Q9M0N7_9MICR|nr:hypothetical protein CWI38_0126p0060 [Hamiltosporidium tvaerminnensis]